ncbi:hypothetical protein AB4Z22_45935, partial [Paenibacillus sp. TAF58]
HQRSEQLHVVSHVNGINPILRLEPEIGPAAVAVGIEATPAQLSLVAGDGRIDAAFDDSGTIRLRGRGLGLALHEAAAALTPFTGTYMFTDPLDGGVVLTSYETGRRYRITVLEGVPSVVGDGALG